MRSDNATLVKNVKLKMSNLTNTSTQKLFISSVVGFIGPLIILPITLLINPIAIKYIGIEQLGLYSLIVGIAATIYVVETGIVKSINQATYEPLVNENWAEVRSLNKLLLKNYKYIAGLFVLFGIILSPFLPVIVNYTHIEIAYMLYVICIADIVGYFLFFVGKRSILEVDQRQYIIQGYSYAFQFLSISLRILVAILFQNIVLYALIELIVRIVISSLVKRRAQKMYGFIDEYDIIDIPKAKMQQIKRNFGGSAIVLVVTLAMSLDNILISMYMGLAEVGKYFNYTTIGLSVIGLFTSFAISFNAAIGQGSVKWNKSEILQNYRVTRFIFFIVITVATAGIYGCIQPFVSLWVGPDYLLSEQIAFLLPLSYALNYLFMTVTEIFISTNGLIWNARNGYIIGTIIRLGLLILLVSVFQLGIIGILLAGMVVTFIQYGIIIIRILNRNIFLTNKTGFYKLSIFYLLQIMVILIVLHFAMNVFEIQNNLAQFFVNGLISVFISAVVIFVANFKTREFRIVWNVAARTFKFIPELEIK